MICKRILLICLLLTSTIRGYSLYSNNGSSHADNEGLSVKFFIGRGIGFDYFDLSFSNGPLRTADMRWSPGAGYNLGIGTTLQTSQFDFDLLLEESIIFGYQSSTGFSSAGSYTESFKSSLFKTNIYATAYLNLFNRSSLNKLRVGAGPVLMLPGKFRVAVDGESKGYSAYNKEIGYQFDTNMVFPLRRFSLNPGLRAKFIHLDSNRNTFNENSEKLNRLNASSIDFYLAIIL